ncbi:MAG: DUF167 domain-containing protein [Candidatus Spechtbacteria bacterium]|nr:DUF167 domain-containing protein [Candidatus Spechtbacteria bacterium]
MKYYVEVKPNSKQNSIEEKDGTLLVRVHAPAREGKANEAVVKLIAKHFHVAPSRVSLIHGERGRKKVVEVVV